MKEWIRRLSDRSEFVLVVALSFAYFVTSSFAVLLMRIREYELTTGHVLRGIAVEILILLVAGWILHVRGWRLRRLTVRPSWLSILAGLPLFIGYYLLYALGLLFGAVYWRWRTLWPLFIAHTVANLFAFAGSARA